MRRLLYPLITLWGQLKELAYWTIYRWKHWQTRHLPPARLDDGVLASLVRWHAHQTEKTTKHVSQGPAKPRGMAHASALRRYLAELQTRNLPAHVEIVAWATHVLALYDDWLVTPGAINQEAVPTAVNQTTAVALPTAEQVIQLMNHRTSTRFWQPKEVPEEIVNQLLAAALQAPSSCSRMGWFFVAVRQPPLPDMRPAVNNQDMLRNAPLIVYFACFNDYYPERYAPALDVGGASQSLLLTAEAFGLRGCSMYHSESFDQADLRQKLDLPASAYIYVAVCLGYPADAPIKPARPALPAVSKIINQRIHP